MRIVKGQLLKIKRTPVPIMCIALPILYSVLLFVYLFLINKGNVTPPFLYRTFYLFLVMAAVFVLSLLVPLFLQVDREASGFGNELRIGVARWKLYLGRFFALVFLLIIVEVLALIVYSGLVLLFRGQILSGKEFIILSISGTYFLLPVLCVYLFVSFRFQLSGAIICGLLFFLSGFLLGTTGLGGGIWLYLPFVWPARMMYQIVPSLLWETGATKELATKIFSVISIANLLVTLFLLLLSLFWYNHWEGVGSLEE